MQRKILKRFVAMFFSDLSVTNELDCIRYQPGRLDSTSGSQQKMTVSTLRPLLLWNLLELEIPQILSS